MAGEIAGWRGLVLDAAMAMRLAGLVVVLHLACTAACARAEAVVGPHVRQLVLAVATGWDAAEGRIQLFQRDGRGWVAASPSWRVLFGRSGLAWGRGEHPEEDQNPGDPRKVERDRRAPAGVFRIGKIYTYDDALPPGARYPFHTITEADAWVDDPLHPDYNRHVTVDPANPPPWFARQRMRLDDPPHRWLVEIRHNADPVLAGAGSAIFFHIQRGPGRASAGCTVMPQADLVRMIRWLRAEDAPRYVLLPRGVYERRWKAWGLPAPELAADLLAP